MRPLFRGAWGGSPYGLEEWGGVPNAIVLGGYGEAWGNAPWGGETLPLRYGGYGDTAWGDSGWGGRVFTDYLADISRVRVTKIEMDIDCCVLGFGILPCTAAGKQCYNSWPTCKSRANYSRYQRLYVYTSANAPLPFRWDERPYLSDAKLNATEIKDTQTVRARGTITLFDEPDTDVELDPYYSARATTPANASYWQRWLARNANYKSRPVRIYEGFIGLAEDGWRQVFNGVIETVKRTDGGISIEVVDLLKALDNIEVPPKLDIKLLSDIASSLTEIVLYQPFSTSVAGLDCCNGYVRIDDEIIKYATFNAVANTLVNCTRGFYGTTAAEHAANGKVQKCRYYNGNAFDILKNEMLKIGAGYIDGDIEVELFEYWRDFPDTNINFEAMISEPTKLGKLYFELGDMIDCRSWVGENLKIAIRRNVPNEPGLEYINLTDEANIANKQVGVDLNDKARYTRVVIYWDPDAIKKSDEAGSYKRIDIAVDADAESPNDADAVIEKKIYCRWITTRSMQEETASNYVRNQASRILFRVNNAQPVIDFEVELKDMDLKTGAFSLIASDSVLDRHGDVVAALFQIVKRDEKGPATVRYSALKYPFKKYIFIAPDDAPDFSASTEAQKQYWYICDDNGLIGDEETSYHIY